jgi:hypothetical protein
MKTLALPALTAALVLVCSLPVTQALPQWLKGLRRAPGTGSSYNPSYGDYGYGYGGYSHSSGPAPTLTGTPTPTSVSASSTGLSVSPVGSSSVTASGMYRSLPQKSC